MYRRSRGTTALFVFGVVASLLSVGLVSVGSVAAEVTAAPSRAAATALAPTFTRDWTQPAGGFIAESSPVVVANGGNPFVAVGANNGALRAFDLDSGTPVPGWGAVNAGAGAANRPQVRAPLSSDGRSVYVPVAVDGKDKYPLFRKYSASGAVQWSSNPATVIPASGGFLLSGLSIASIGGKIRGFGGSSGHWIFAVDGARGGKLWGARNADSTMATPALADLYGAGRPQVIVSSDTTAEFTGDRNGGIFRIFTDTGYQICSATQLVSGKAYASSGYNNSSPAVAEIGGQPLIVFGSTGPKQYGTGGNQLVAYDSSCRLKWATVDLGGRANTSPTFADVLGTGHPQIIELVSVSYSGGKYPRILVIDPSNGRVIANTGGALSPYGATSIAYTQGTSIATADFNADGAQDMVVPAKQGKFVVLNGRTRAVMATIPTDIVVQNTPVITQEPTGLRVTIAGYNGLGGRVSSYTTPSGKLGTNAWPKFGNNAGLTGLQGRLAGPYDQLLEYSTLPAGRTIRSSKGGYFAAMQKDGNFVVYTAAGRPRWWTKTRTPGSRLVVRGDGRLQVTAPDGIVKWQSSAVGKGVERLELGNDGRLRVFSGVPSGATRLLTVTSTVWATG